MADAALDFLLENMMQLINGSNPLMFLLKKDEMVCLYEEMQFLRKFLMDSVEARTEHKEVRDLVGKIGVLTCEVDDIIDSFILIAFVQREETSKSGIFSLFHRFDYHDKKIHHHVMEEQKLESGSISSRFHLNFSKDLETRYDKVSRIEGIKSFAAERIGDGLGCIMEEIYSIKTKVTEIYEKKKYGIRVLQAPKCSHSSSASPRATSPIIEEETVVGMDDDILAIKEQLFAEAEMRIKLIPIIGMPGLGKTTLARKLYSDPLIVYKFHVRAWTCVSQEYQKRDLLLSILFSAQIIPSHCTEIDGKGDEQLGDMLYKGLKGLKYLIFMDDVWKIHPWNDLKRYLPDDNNGSRVVFTSRHVEVAVHAKPHNLRFLNEKESWDLLQRKVFGKESCPPELIGTGEKIAKKCQGLPLAILTMSGLLLKNDKTLDWWRYVSNNVSSHIISEPEQYMATLELSYNHLPFYLKPCFLYFGAFPEDCEIPVQNLFWLWIAEGFIRKDELKSLEEAAEGYLMDLVERSLVAVSKKKCDGRIKTCRIHDLLRDLCVRKAQKESFFGKISRFDLHFPSSSYILNKYRRVSLHSEIELYMYPKGQGLHVRSFLSFKRSLLHKSLLCLPSICRDFKLVRVLDISSIKMSVFPLEIEFLVHLRYLALRGGNGKFQPSISNLWNLETFIFKGSQMHVCLRDDIWKMVKLRHLFIEPYFNFPPVPKDCHHFILDNMQSIKAADLGYGEERVLACMPNIKGLKCYVNKSWNNYIHFPKLDFLSQLQKLHVSFSKVRGFTTTPRVNEFPPNLKCLTLSNLSIYGGTMSIIGRLPNLEILKLSYAAFMGLTWHKGDGKFCKLKYLKFEHIFLVKWEVSSDQFANLRTLVLKDCTPLDQIPCELGDILTLEVIELQCCSEVVENAAREFQRQQQSMLNDGLKVIIHPWNHDLIDN